MGVIRTAAAQFVKLLFCPMRKKHCWELYLLKQWTWQ